MNGNESNKESNKETPDVPRSFWRMFSPFQKTIAIVLITGGIATGTWLGVRLVETERKVQELEAKAQRLSAANQNLRTINSKLIQALDQYRGRSLERTKELSDDMKELRDKADSLSHSP